MWKPKEKELTLEDAILLAKKELEPYWFGISPQLAGFHSGGDQYSAVPLDPEFAKKNWILFFFDPTRYSGALTLNFFREWYERYSSSLEFLTIVSSNYPFLKERSWMRDFIDENNIPPKVVVDIDKSIGKAFSVEALPHMILLEKGKKIFEYSSHRKIIATELNIQTFLRATDPGLPLFPVREFEKNATYDLANFEFGQNVEKIKDVKNNSIEVVVAGEWQKEDSRITTRDVHSYITFNCAGDSVSVVAESLSKNLEVSKVAIEIDGSPAYEAISGSHVAMDETGQSVAKVTKPKVYSLLMRLPKDSHQITLRFPNANLAPLSLYGLRIGKTGVE